jgi:hypothetical protein
MQFNILTTTNRTVLSRTMILVVGFLSVLACLCWLLVTVPPRKAFVGLFDIDSDLPSPAPLYTLKNTTVSLVRGSILKPPVKAGIASAIAYSAKLNLSPPFKSNSIDSLMRKKLGGDYSDYLKEQSERKLSCALQSHKIGKRGFWIHDVVHSVDGKFSANGASIYLIAGVSAKPTNGSESKLLKSRKPEIIRSAVYALCKKASQDNIKELFISLIGAGAADVDKGVAIDALLSGINKASFYRQCPKSVTIVLWPEKTEIDEMKEAERRAKWLEIGEMFRVIVASESIYDKDLFIWDYRRLYILIAQLCIVCSCPFISALTALNSRTIPVVLTLGAVLGKVVKWGVLGAGVTVSQQNFGGIVPVSPANIAVLALLAFSLPFWDWHKLSEPVERNTDSS